MNKICPFTLAFFIVFGIPYLKERSKIENFKYNDNGNNNKKIISISKNNRIFYDSVVILYDFEELSSMKIVYRSIKQLHLIKE